MKLSWEADVSDALGFHFFLVTPEPVFARFINL